MNHTALQRYIKDLDITSSHELKDCDLVVDADSYFKNSYKTSGCQFILGPDCDRYATFITQKLKTFLDSKIKCYFIFKGATKRELEDRKEIHQEIIEHINDIERDLDNAKYFPPFFVQDVQKQVLEKLEIKYFVCEYDSMEAIVGVARKFKCPVLTNNIEYSLFGVACIPQNSLEYDKAHLKLSGKIYNQEQVKTAIGVYSKMPVLFTLLNESADYLENFNGIIRSGESDEIFPVIRWVKRQREKDLVSTVSKIICNETDNKGFLKVYEKIQTLYLYPSCNIAVKYFQRGKPYGFYKDDKKWFEKGIANGIIAPLYINLKNEGFVCGSLQMNDRNRPDAIQAAIDIIAYAHCLLTNSQDSTFTLLERKRDSSSIRKVDIHWDEKISNRDIFTEHSGRKSKFSTGDSDLFQLFLEEVLPGYDFKEVPVQVPDECWILIITLVYYIHKKNKKFINGAYCVLLSYLMLGPVTAKKNAGLSILPLNGVKDSTKFYNGLCFLFNTVDVKNKYDSTIVHNLSEFQHCLQNMNYLNKLCGERIPCTVYHGTYNATFVYNTLLFMNDKYHLMTFLKNNFTCSNLIQKFKNIVIGFENCLCSVELFEKNNKRISNYYTYASHVLMRWKNKYLYLKNN